MSFGQTLRTAREAKGLTASELAASTHLLVQIVEGLENEDFRRIPAPIYGRGFVKLYCETVGLDPKPMQAEFMNLYAQGKNAPATVRAEPPPPVVEPPPPVVEPPPPVAKPAPTPAVEPEPLPVAKPAPTPAAEPEPLPQAEPEPPPRRSYGDLFEQAYAQPEPPKPSATDKFRDTMSNVSHGVFANVKKLPPNTGRMVMVLIAALLLLALIGWGISALYRATTPHPAPEKPVATSAAPATPNQAPAKATPASAKATQSPAKANPAPAKAEPETAKAGPLPTKRAAASGGGSASDVQPKELTASGIQIPSLYID